MATSFMTLCSVGSIKIMAGCNIDRVSVSDAADHFEQNNTEIFILDTSSTQRTDRIYIKMCFV